MKRIRGFTALRGYIENNGDGDNVFVLLNTAKYYLKPGETIDFKFKQGFFRNYLDIIHEGRTEVTNDD